MADATENLEIKDYFFEDNNQNIRLKFSDGANLKIIPYRDIGRPMFLNRALLYKNNILEALVIENPVLYTTAESRGFWSRGKVKQQDLAKYMASYLELADLYYHINHIKENSDLSGLTHVEDWVAKYKPLWDILREGWVSEYALAQGKSRVFEEKPDF